MNTKYGDLNISNNEYKKNIVRLTNQIWKLIPMKENQEDWKKQLDTVILEIVGMNEIFQNDSSLFIQLLSKLEGLSIQENIDFEFFRKTIFECLSLLQKTRNII